ncbi:unnamed protein product [Mytilus edulis]|uniref:Endonuclease/exonuclease/phosphatase domain-containing protein n=1 Tax=Mytilus edulis TaxID=6550 RepID=A0A8S3PNM8_MYTED|nr:unnamed protein product [Mytilus edulis]
MDLPYVPPANSSYTKKLDFDIIDQIEKDIVSYKSKGDILFCGDLNARTSTEEDYIAQDSSRYLPLFESYKPDNQIRFRKNCDETLDSRGKEIIDLCISNQMRVVNGRCMGDLLGHFTCFNTHGQSTVDYLIANERLFNQILYFRVSEFVSTFSDCHCKISWEILAKYQITETQSNNLHAAPVNFRWTEDSPLKFQQALLSPDNQQKISSFLINDSDCSSEDINKKAQDLCDIFLSAAKISLVTPKKNKKGSRPQKKWFDSDLFKMRKNVISLGKIYSRYPKDPVIKGRYYKYFRIYNKCRKVKYKQFINSMLQKLDTLRVENPKQYWKLINDIQDSKKENCSSQIDSDTWANHFRNLHSAIDNTFYSRLNQLEMILNDKEKYLVFNDLDNDISKKEISDAIASLKSGKACGPDLISNEMLKYIGDWFTATKTFECFGLIGSIACLVLIGIFICVGRCSGSKCIAVFNVIVLLGTGACILIAIIIYASEAGNLAWAFGLATTGGVCFALAGIFMIVSMCHFEKMLKLLWPSSIANSALLDTHHSSFVWSIINRYIWQSSGEYGVPCRSWSYNLLIRVLSQACYVRFHIWPNQNLPIR